jgi:uncharacterized protein (DUF4415 family)
MVAVRCKLLTLIYVERASDIQVTSLRVASRVREKCMNKRKSRTDWKRVKPIGESDPVPYSPEDGPYDPNNAKATKAYLSSAIVRRPGQRGRQKSATKQLVSLRLSRAVLEYFKSTGPDWQTRIDEVLTKASRKWRRRLTSPRWTPQTATASLLDPGKPPHIQPPADHSASSPRLTTPGGQE